MDSTKTKKKSSKPKTRRFAPLTDKKLQAVGPTSKRYTLRDGRGLFLDVTPGGVQTWIFRYQFNGKQEKFTIGRYPEFSLKAARGERDELAVKVSRGVLRLSPWLTQTVKTMFAVRCEILDRQDHFSAF